MDPDRPLALLGGLSPALFVRRHWQRKPLLVRASGAGELAGFGRRALFALAAEDDVESRLVVRAGRRWTVRAGPIARRALPPLATPAWSLLVQGVDLHDERARRLLDRFRFVADARLDDVMISYASDGGGVGPHVDSYDVFLLQVEGRRRWRVGPVTRPRLRTDVPLKMLSGFSARDEWLLEPGDMLYLPPGYGHDGVAVGACLTASIGFRAPTAEALATDIAQRLGENIAAEALLAPARASSRYRDDADAATGRPARIPSALGRFASEAVARLLADDVARARALGETLSEPKPGTWFARCDVVSARRGVGLDRRTRMLYDERHVFVNGDAFRVGGRDATLLRRLADRRRLDATEVARLSTGAVAELIDWLRIGWCVPLGQGAQEEES